MADNKLNLIVQFMGLDKLSPAMKNIIGLGKSGKQVLGEMGAQQRKLNKEIADYDRLIKASSGNVTGLFVAQKRLIEQQDLLAGKIQQQKRLLAIDSTVSRVQARGASYVQQGTSGLIWTAALLAPMYQMAKAAGEAQSMDNRLRVLGLDNATVNTLETNARRAQVAGASYIDMLRYTVEAQGAFRESGQHSLAERTFGARTMVPILARMSFASKAMGMELPEDQERYLLRFIEEAGGMSDPRRAAAIADGVFRALQSSGGNVQASDYQQFMAAAGTSGMKLSGRSLFADFEPLIGELHEAAGVGLMSSYLRLNGVGRVLQQPANEMRRLGLWSGKTPGMSQQNAAMFASDPVEFYRNVVLAAYAKGGVKDTQRENALVFGRTGGALFNQIDRQLPAILRSRSAYAQTQGLDAAYKGAVNSFFGQQGQMTAAWKDFLVVAGSKGGVLEQLTGALRTATGALRGLTAFGNAHPTAFKWIGTLLTWSIGLRIAWFALKIAFGGILGPAARLWGLFAKFRVLGGFSWLFDLIAGSRAAGIAMRVLIVSGEAIMGVLGGISLATMGWIAAIGLAVFAIWHWRKQIWSALSSVPGLMTNIGHMMMIGLVAALNPDILVHRLLDVAHQGVTAFKNYFGIHSPSRLMMDMGGHIASGLAVGVDRNAHKPLRAIARVGAGIAGAVALSAAPAGAHGMRGGVTINVYQLPGEDSHALARRVAALLDQRDRNHRRASYQDDY